MRCVFAGRSRARSGWSRVLPILPRGESGNAVIEFALIGSMMPVILFNMYEVSRYGYILMDVQAAAQMGAQAAFATCKDKTPAKTACSSLTSAITTAIQATSLGASVTLAAGYPTEIYYCSTAANTLVNVGAYDAKPSPFDCTAAGDAGATPGDYVEVQVNYSYAPVMSGVSVMSAKTLTGTAMMRLQ